MTGFEPATSGATVRRSTAELHPPLTGRGDDSATAYASRRNAKCSIPNRPLSGRGDSRHLAEGVRGLGCITTPIRRLDGGGAAVPGIHECTVLHSDGGGVHVG
jgi:hypothetical protein